MDLSPKQLDEQSPVRIDRWVDAYSEECRMMDEDHKFTCYLIRTGFRDPPFMFLDSDGRIWGKGVGEKYYPLHMECGSKLIGFRICKKASN